MNPGCLPQCRCRPLGIDVCVLPNATWVHWVRYLFHYNVENKHESMQLRTQGGTYNEGALQGAIASSEFRLSMQLLFGYTPNLTSGIHDVRYPLWMNPHPGNFFNTAINVYQNSHLKEHEMNTFEVKRHVPSCWWPATCFVIPRREEMHYQIKAENSK